MARKGRARPIGRFYSFNNGEATTANVANTMAATAYSLNVISAQVYEPKHEKWSETVDLRFTEEIDGYIVDEKVGKVLTKVKNVSFFIGDIIKALCAANADVAAFLAAKKHDEKVHLIPMLLAASVINLEVEIKEDEQKAFHTALDITVNNAMQQRITKALDALFSF